MAALNPDLKLDELNIDIVRSPLPWPVDSTERISVNAFGYGGANAHTIADSAAMHMPSTEVASSHMNKNIVNSVLLLFSAHHPETLVKNIEAILNLDLSSSELPYLAYILAERRSLLTYKSYVTGTSTYNRVEFSPSTTPKLSPNSEPTLVFVFTGQGARWPGMGRKLLENFSVLENVIDDVDGYLSTLPHSPSWTIKSTILDATREDIIHKADRSQTLCAAI